MPLRLYNTLSRQVELVTPRDPRRVTFYTCGPTVYDDAHIGNFRSFLAADVLRRFLESPLCALVNDSQAGTEDPARRAGVPRTVIHVMNITDVGHMVDDADDGEDKMAVAGKRLAEAKKAGKLPADVRIDPNDPYAIARFYEARFLEDARRLGLKVAIDAEKDPSLMPRATASIAGMITVIGRLIERGHAYVVSTPAGSESQPTKTVYFRVKSFAAYGRLSGNTLDKLREGEGGRVATSHQAQKEHPADFLLWKEDSTHLMKWDSPWGAGYPGWHIECSVMSAERLSQAVNGQSGKAAQGGVGLGALTLPGGEALIDLHSGGEDNIFPHHECEMAQSCCAFNESPAAGTFARHWFHPRFLMVEGEKMSKSRGNFFTARDLFAKGIEPAALRLELIKTHYRSNANFTMQGLADSQRMIERWRRVAGEKPSSAAGDSAVLREFATAMHEDLNVAGAMGVLNGWTNSVAAPSEADRATMWSMDAVLGLLERERGESTSNEIGLFGPGVEASTRVEALLRERRDARAGKNFKRSDAIRDELAGMGLAIKDVAGGKVEVTRKG